MAKLIFERSVKGRGTHLIPPCQVEEISMPAALQRESAPNLPQVSEGEVSRHYAALEREVFGVCHGFYPLGSCTMKYNPALNERTASLAGFQDVHPLQELDTVQGSLEMLCQLEESLSEITGMDAMTFQPAAGAHGELLGVMLIKAFHQKWGDAQRDTILIPDTAHGTNPATASMCGFKVVTVPSNERGQVDVDALRSLCNERVAGLMLTNPNTLGIFEERVLEITELVHHCGGLNYYDGANLNAIMGVARPGDMGFDVVHLNLHKTFSTPHGGGGPGSGAVGCKAHLTGFLPHHKAQRNEDRVTMRHPTNSIGRVKAFYGNTAVNVKALTYLLTLGAEGVRAAAQNAVLNANYLKSKLSSAYTVAYEGTCMHEFVLTLAPQKAALGITAMDIAKSLLDQGMHPPTMYFPLLVDEALMLEPTETESRETLDEVSEIYVNLLTLAEHDVNQLHAAPVHTIIGRPDEVRAARSPKLRYVFEENSPCTI